MYINIYTNLILNIERVISLLITYLKGNILLLLLLLSIFVIITLYNIISNNKFIRTFNQLQILP